MVDKNYSYDPVATNNHEEKKVEAGQLWRQYIIAGIANIAIVSLGYIMGWTSPISPLLTNENRTSESPLYKVATSDEIAWMGSILNIGAIFSPFIAGFLASRIGRKWALLSATVPLFLGWTLVGIAGKIEMLWAGRFFWGIGAGWIFTISPMYCAEIATTESRGALGSFILLFMTFGYLLVYVVGPYFSYNVVTFIGAGLVASFVLLFFFMPDSPTYYMYKGDRENAIKCLMQIRGRSRAGVEEEIAIIEADVKASLERSATLGDLFHGSNFKAFYISNTLLFFQQFCGINAVLYYMTDIFRTSGLDIADIATIIIGAVQMAASFVTAFTVDRLGRRLLLLISTAGTAIGLAMLGTFFILKDNGSPIIESISFLPIFALILFIVTYCWGIGPLAWAILSELFPVEVKTVASPIATAFTWAMSFVVTKFFPTLAAQIGMYLGFFIFCGCCVAAFFFTLFVVPETKGKTLQEIQEILGAGKHRSEKA